MSKQVLKYFIDEAIAKIALQGKEIGRLQNMKPAAELEITCARLNEQLNAGMAENARLRTLVIDRDATISKLKRSDQSNAHIELQHKYAKLQQENSRLTAILFHNGIDCKDDIDTKEEIKSDG